MLKYIKVVTGLLVILTFILTFSLRYIKKSLSLDALTLFYQVYVIITLKCLILPWILHNLTSKAANSAIATGKALLALCKY